MPFRALLGPVVSILVVAGLATGLLMQGSRHDFRDNDLKKFSRQMQDWMRRLRGRPLQGSAAAARLKALKERNSLAARLESRSNGVQQVSGGATWISLGPQPANDLSYGEAGGRATAIAVDPTNDNIVFAGTSDGGVWRSSDNGQTWDPLTDSQSSLAIGSLAIDPTNHLTISAGTGEKEDFGQDAYYGAGILKSTDGGVTWTQSLAVQSAQFATSVIFDNVGSAYAGVGSFQQASGSTNAIVGFAYAPARLHANGAIKV